MLSKENPPFRAAGFNNKVVSLVRTDTMTPSYCPPPQSATWPAPLHADALHGVAGHLLQAVEDYTEADSAALLIQLLVGVGNMIGPGPHFMAGADRHNTNLFAVVAGETAKARKGMSWGLIKTVLGRADLKWSDERIKSGLASGEGLIAAFNGSTDRRLLVCEPEYSRVLRVSDRTGCTLPDILRQGWDCGNLAVMTRTDPLDVRGAHISIIGHITIEELQALLPNIATLNGFANRFLWVCARRARLLPAGEPIPKHLLLYFANELKTVLKFSQKVGALKRDRAAEDLWDPMYRKFADGAPGTFGAAIARAEAQVMRLACIYALLDSSQIIGVEHLKAGHAAWQYCEDSARHIFGQALGNPVADKILQALQASPNGLTRSAISQLFSNNASGQILGQALGALEREGKATKHSVTGVGGRPAERWYAIKK